MILLAFKIDEELKTRFKIYCLEHKTTMKDFLTKIIKEALELK